MFCQPGKAALLRLYLGRCASPKATNLCNAQSTCWCWTRDDPRPSCCSCPLLSLERFRAPSKRGEAAAGEVGFMGYPWACSLHSNAKREVERAQEWGGFTGLDVWCYGDTPSPIVAVSPSGHSGLQAAAPAQAASCIILRPF